MKTALQPSTTSNLPPAVQEQIDLLLDGVATRINQIAQEMACVSPTEVLSVIAKHRSDFARHMEALGNWIADYLAHDPEPDEAQLARASIAGPLGAWASTCPLFFRIVHTPSNKLDGFEISELLLENRSGGADSTAQILDYYYLNMVTVNSYRNRFWSLVNELAAQTTRRATDDNPVRILSLHTGSGPEVLQLAKDRTFVRAAEVTCVEADALALRRVRDKLKARLLRPVNIVFADPLTYLAERTHADPSYDLIYAVTLFDQLKDPRATRLIQDCYRWLKPGGSLIFGNYAQSMPISERMIISWCMNWDIRCRSEEGLKKLFDHTSFGTASMRVRYDSLQASMLVLADR